MDEELARDYLQKSDFSPVQADALAKLVSQMATRDDLRALGDRLDSRFDSMETRLRTEIARAVADVRVELGREIARTRADLSAEIAGVRADLSTEIAGVRADLSTDIAGVRADLSGQIAETHASIMRWCISMIVTLATIMTLLELFVG